MEVVLGRKVLDSQLPATMCTEEMSEKIRAIAKENNVSLADVQRAAYEVFLSQYPKQIRVKIHQRGKRNAKK